MLKRNEIYQGDCRELLEQLDDESIDCFITSPPYWSLRDYGIEPTVWDGDPECEHDFQLDKRMGYGEKKVRWQNQSSGESLLKGKIDNPNAYKDWDDNKKKEFKSGFCSRCGAWLGTLGLEPNFEQFIKHLVDIYDIVYRKLKKTGTCWINLGDSYGSHSSGESQKDMITTKRNPLKHYEKCLLMIPQRFAIEMISRGWILRNTIIWCLSSKTVMFAKINNKYKELTLKELNNKFLKGKEIYLPTSDKGNNKWVKLTNIFKSDEKIGYKITLTNGLDVIATKDHKFPVKKSSLANDNPNYIKLDFKKVKDIKIGDYLWINIKFEIKEKDKSLTYNDGLGVGIFIAEGCYLRKKRQNKGNNLSKNALKRWFKEKGYSSIEEYLKNRTDIVGINISHTDREFINKLNFDIKSYGNIANHSRDKRYLKLIKKFVKGHNSYTKRLRNNAWNTNKQFLKGILDGYLQGDGCNDKENNRWRLCFTSRNPYLMGDLNLLCKIFGYDFRKQGIDNISQRGQLRKEWNRNKFKNLISQQIKQIKKIEGHGFYDLTIEPIYYGGKGNNQYKKIEGPTENKQLKKWNHLFCIGNGILTHNCKPNAMPSSAKDRFTVDFEYVYFFVKRKKYAFTPQREHLSQNPATQERYKYKVGNQDNRKDIGVNLVKPGKPFNIYFPKDLPTKSKYKNILEEAQYRAGMHKKRGSKLIEKRNLPPAENIVKYLKKWKNKSYKELDLILEKKGDTASHWFTYPDKEHGFAYPSKEDWFKLKELFGFDDLYDKQMTKIYFETDAIGKSNIKYGKCEKYWFEQQREPHQSDYKGGNRIDREIINFKGLRRCPDIMPNPLGRNKRCVWTHESTFTEVFSKLPLEIQQLILEQLSNGKTTTWTIPTQPNPEAHFATFPSSLVKPIILSGYPEFICSKCGKPREKIIEKEYISKLDNSISERGMKADKMTVNIKRFGNGIKNIKTVGYTDCGCNAKFINGIVLDPFAGCYDKKTEILTKKGWKLFKYITMNDGIATLNKSHEMYYIKPLKLHKYFYNGKMVKVNHRSIDLLITPNHNMYLKEDHRNNYEFMRADTIKYENLRALNSVEWKGEEKKWFWLPWTEKNTSAIRRTRIKMDIFLEFLGWYISEGHYNHSKYTIAITQSEKENQKDIKKCLEKLGYNFNFVQNRRFRIHNKQLYLYLKKLGKVHQKYIPLEFMNLSKRQLKILLDSLIKGDGYIRKSGRVHYFTTSKRLANQIQELIIKLGYNSTLRKRWRQPRYIKSLERFIGSKHMMYEIDLRSTKECRLSRSKHFSLKDYNGFVYCCTVPDHILCVRRKGRPIWCGNTGTTLKTAFELGRDYIGFEISKEYVDKIAKKFLDSTKNKRITDYFDLPQTKKLLKIVIDDIKKEKEGGLLSLSDVYLYNQCPTCNIPLQEIDPNFYYCDQCGEHWSIDELEFRPIQRDLGEWLNIKENGGEK